MLEPLYLEDYPKTLMHLAQAKLNPLRLSKADELMLGAMVELNAGYALTQPQIELIRKLVKKYHKQLSKHGLSDTDIDKVQTRLTPRQSQDPAEATLDFDGAHFRFTFTHRMKKSPLAHTDSKGLFDVNQGLAYPSLHNIRILNQYIKQYIIDVSDRAADIIVQAMHYEKQNKNYKFYLNPDCTIDHAPPELIAHLHEKLKSVNPELRFNWLYDRAFVYGLDVTKVKQPNLCNIKNWHNKVMEFEHSSLINIENLLEYTQAVGRKYIVHIYPRGNIVKEIPLPKPYDNLINRVDSVNDFVVNKINALYLESKTPSYLNKIFDSELLSDIVFVVTNSVLSSTIPVKMLKI